MNDSKNNWYEVWADEGLEPPYLLVLGFSAQESKYCLYDPKESDKIVFESNSYEETKNWLLEDEYTLVDGRMDIEPG